MKLNCCFSIIILIHNADRSIYYINKNCLFGIKLLFKIYLAIIVLLDTDLLHIYLIIL